MRKSVFAFVTGFVAFGFGFGSALMPTDADAAPLTDWGSSTFLTFRECEGVPIDEYCLGQRINTSRAFLLFGEVNNLIRTDGVNSSFGRVSFGNVLDTPTVRGSGFSTVEANTRNGSSTLAVQGYEYTGSIAEFITFGGMFEYEHTSTLAFGAGSAELSARIYLLSSTVDIAALLPCVMPQFCLPPGDILGVEIAEPMEPATTGVTSIPLQLGFFVNPGDRFYVAATIQTFGNRGGFADASNSLVTFLDAAPEVLAALSPATRVTDPVIDIKPGSHSNSFNPDSQGVVPVAILTTSTGAGDTLDFDATHVDPLTVQFGPDGAMEAHGRGHVKDVDGDGDLDLVLHFETRQTGIACGNIEASVAGITFAGEDIEGTDSIRTVGC